MFHRDLMQCVYDGLRTCFHVTMETLKRFAVPNSSLDPFLIKDGSLAMIAPPGEPFDARLGCQTGLPR